jgi:RNA polymerase sigma-70 factor (ECF subfamily)
VEKADEQLMREFQEGSVDAFDALFRRHRQPLWGFFRRRLDDGARAEELAQETFLAVIRGIARYEPRASFKTYLYGVAFNILSMERRRMRLRQADPLGDVDVAAHGVQPETALWVRNAIARLDPDEREILLLREYEQLSYDEIAAVLDIPVNTVRSRLFRARQALRRLLISAPEPAGMTRDERL